MNSVNITVVLLGRGGGVSGWVSNASHSLAGWVSYARFIDADSVLCSRFREFSIVSLVGRICDVWGNRALKYYYY